MKFFISGQIDEAPTIETMIQTVRASGHDITHDWTITDTFLGGSEQKLHDRIETGRRAKADIQAVIDSDIYVVSTDNTKIGKGMCVELGAAIALYETTGKPKVYVVGKMNHLTIFYLHPSVKSLNTIDDVIADIVTIA